MLILRNTSGASVGAGTTVIPFTFVENTNNDIMSWSSASNSATMKQAGKYNTSCTAVITSNSAGAVTVQLLANGTPLKGIYAETETAASEYTTLSLNTPISVSTSGDSDAYLQWAITSEATVNIATAFADIQRVQ